MVRLRDVTTRIPQPIRFGLRRLYHRGSGATCVLCGNGVRAFVSHGGDAEVLDRRKVVGGMRRENDRCPVCHGCDRTRMMMLWLEQAGLDGGGARILHIAPDLGLYLWLRRQDGVEYVGSDIDAARYRHIENMHTADLTRMPFPDDDFDLVICSHVLEHVPDDAAAMREILRILRPGGRALLLTPYAQDGKGTDEDPTVEDPSERNRRFGQWDHVRIYDREDFLARMRRAGFETSVFAPFESCSEAAEALHLNPLEVLPVGTKPADGAP
jgi:SAM-dependent methyltransferase